MEKAQSKKKVKVSPQKMKAAYVEQVLVEGKPPSSVFLFCRNLKISESDFYVHFNSFPALEKAIWDDLLTETIEILNKDENYPNYTVREKMLALLFTWVEQLKENRSYVGYQFANIPRQDVMPGFLGAAKLTFESFFKELIVEGVESDEIADRKPLTMHYAKAFWAQFVFVTRFWVGDESKGFEKTDAFIEKSVHFAFNLVGKGVIDSFLDLSKFLMQNMRPNS